MCASLDVVNFLTWACSRQIIQLVCHRVWGQWITGSRYKQDWKLNLLHSSVVIPLDVTETCCQATHTWHKVSHRILNVCEWTFKDDSLMQIWPLQIGHYSSCAAKRFTPEDGLYFRLAASTLDISGVICYNRLYIVHESSLSGLGLITVRKTTIGEGHYTCLHRNALLSEETYFIGQVYTRTMHVLN